MFFENIDNKAVDTENAVSSEEYINGNRVTVIQKGEDIRLIMYKDNHEFCLQGNINIDEGYKILKNIK